MYTVLIADETHASIIPMLKNIGIIADYQPFIQRNEIKSILKNYDGIILRSKTFIDAELLDAAPKLKFIGRSGAGLDLIDLKETTKRNIAVFQASEGNRVAVAEHVLGMILCLFNKIVISDKQVRQGIWHREANRGLELMGKTIGIIGYGNNGSATAQRFKAFGCKVLAYDKNKHSFSDEFVEEASMERIFQETDILSLHIPLTSDTNRMVNTEYLNRFQKNIYLINAARGEIVVLHDLVYALQNGKVHGACLDVLENEKIQQFSETNKELFLYLTQSEKTILTPHIAGWTHESYVKLNEVLVEKIKTFLKL